MGASVLVGHYSRMVVDLNRPADDTPLYASATTGLFPSTLFDGTPTFVAGKAPTPEQRYGYALLFDAHSIASHIPRLFDGKLPDLNIGTNGGESCSTEVEAAIRARCEEQEQYSWVINGRFKGGYITRAYGQPAQQQHAVQLELAQCNYMEEQVPFARHAEKAAALQVQLKKMLESYLACF